MTPQRLSDLWSYGPSLADQDTLRSLGLDPIRRAEGAYQWIEFGEVDVTDGEGGTVKIEASYAPATFWRFTIQSGGNEFESDRYLVLETGSGSLADFWPIAQKFASGMLVVAEAEATS